MRCRYCGESIKWNSTINDWFANVADYICDGKTGPDHKPLPEHEVVANILKNYDLQEMPSGDNIVTSARKS